MMRRLFDPRPFTARGVGIQAIAAIQFVAAFGLASLIVLNWNARDFSGSLVEVSVWALLAAALAALGWGLAKRRGWARTTALVLHWPLCIGVWALLAASGFFLALVPAQGIAVVHAIAWLCLWVLPPIGCLSAGTLWYLHRRTEPAH